MLKVLKKELGGRAEKQTHHIVSDGEIQKSIVKNLKIKKIIAEKPRRNSCYNDIALYKVQ